MSSHKKTIASAIQALSLASMPLLGAATDESAYLKAWADHALLGKNAESPTDSPGLTVLRQDYGTLGIGKSAIDSPLHIGTQSYEHGLGTHAVSEIQVRLPAPARQFSAQLGINNNDPHGKGGSVIFVLEANGKELFRSGTCRGGEAAVPVQLDLPDVQQLTLRVLAAGTDISFGQADWAEAKVKLADGTDLWLDALPQSSKDTGMSTAIPFSFVYGGKPSASLLPAWQRDMTSDKPQPGTERHTITYTDPETKLQVRCVATQYAAHPAVEWVLSFQNTGTADTPIIERISPLDLHVTTPPAAGGQDVTLHHSRGSSAGPTDFLPTDEPLGAKKSIDLSPAGGRSSNGTLPFFNLQWSNGGLVGAIGWSGQWALHVERDEKSGLTLRAGQQTTHLTLHPGESIRTPRILLVHWQGTDYLRGQNLFRQVMLDHYTMRVNGEIAVPPMAQMTWFTFNVGNDVTESNQLAYMQGMSKTGIEAFWMDAGWFEGGWPAGAGSWVPKKTAFPQGLKPIGDGAHKLGMRFVLWFEPERVTANSLIAKAHPEWVMHHPGEVEWGALFNLGNPDARKAMTSQLSQCIGDWGVDVFRNDFNIDPLPFWKAADAPDRQGMAEIRYIEGLYAMWDELRALHPSLTIDNCASGGRRIDLETTSRSYPLWQSDTQCGGKPAPVGDQVQNAGLSLYVPLHAAGVWGFDPYNFRSVVTAGCSVCPDISAPAIHEAATKMIAEAKTLRPYYLGDYYPLMAINADDQFWCAWQYDRPDLGQGFVMCFRREHSPFSSADLGLHGLEPESRYCLTNGDDHTTQTLTGAELASHFAIHIAKSSGSVLFTYERVK